MTILPPMGTGVAIVKVRVTGFMLRVPALASAALYTIVGVELTKPEPVTAIGIVAPAVAAAASMMMPVLG